MHNPPTPLDYSYIDDLIIPVDVGIGIKWKDKENHKCETFISPHNYENGKRIATFTLSTYKGGYCITAIHYYANIKIPSPCIKDITKNAIYGIGGYGPEQPKEYLNSINIQVVHILTKLEYDLEDELLGKIGETTTRFNTEEESKQAAINFFKKKFSPGWILKGEDLDEPIYAET